MSCCKSCKSTNLTPDSFTGNLACSSCGVIQDFNNYEQQTFTADGPTGTNLRLGKSGSQYDYSYRETKLYLARNTISEILSNLGLAERFEEVNNMIKLITEDEYGSGKWFRVLVAACAYIVRRKANKWFPLTSICDSTDCDVFELGRMVSRVVEHLDLRLPDCDMVGLFDRVMKELVTDRGDIGKEQNKRMVKQGIFLLQCMIKWYVTTGRRPVPAVVAVIVFVFELNEVEVSMDELASKLNVSAATCKVRYNELLKRLVEVARVNLPWGDDVTVKNIMKNAAVVIQFMEVKSMCDPGKEVDTLENVEDLDSFIEEFGLNETRGSVDWEIEDLERVNVSSECLSTIYSKYLEEYANIKTSVKRVDNMVTESSERFNLCLDTTDYWRGDSELSKKLFLDKILEKDVGLDVMPPSFVNGRLKTRKREEKIKAAKVRIEKIRRPLVVETGFNEGDEDLLMLKSRKRKRKSKRKIDIDWEDFVIETLLLHDVKEEEIVKGYYNALLDLHVFFSLTT